MYKLLESSNIPESSFVSISLDNRYEGDFVKTAAKRDLPKEVDEAIKNLVKKKNHSYILTTALGDGETWGSNRNGDYFPYDGLFGKQNEAVLGEVAGKDERLNPKSNPIQRYLTFRDSLFFHHHRNKPERGDPSYGYVDNAIWNPKMHTVLLIVGVDRNRDPETASMIDNNDPLKVSMGAKLPWDRCSICGSKHKTLLQYCPHLKFNMHKIYGDGRKAYAENLHPRFFDISKVLKPAFIAGHQLEKVARENQGIFSIDLAEEYDLGRFDKLAIEKESTLYKEIPTHVEATIARTCKTEKDLPHKLLEDLATLKPQQVWGALTHAGIIAKPNEFAYIILKNSGADELADKFVHKVGILTHEKIKGLDEQLHSLASIHIDHTALKAAKNIPDHVLEERSVATINDRVYNTDKGLRKEAGVTGTVGIGSILSALYLLYRKEAESHFNAYGLLGAGISALTRDKKDSVKYIGNNATITDVMNKQAADIKPFWHTGKGMFLRGAGGFVAPYILSAHYQNKMNQGYNVGTIGRFMANNPGKLGLIGAAAAVNPTAMWKGTKTVLTDASNIFKSKK